MTNDSTDPLPVFSAGGCCEQFCRGQGYSLFDAVYPALQRQYLAERGGGGGQTPSHGFQTSSFRMKGPDDEVRSLEEGNSGKMAWTLSL